MFKYRGIIEGFYGQPWSHQERLKLLNWMGRMGYTHYLYAPKADTYHRSDWRSPYPTQEMERFIELIESAARAGVVFGMAISPGLSMVYSSKEDREILYEKLVSFVHRGVGLIGVFFDDIPLEMHHQEDCQAYSSLAQAQVDLVNDMYARLSKEKNSIEIIFCPTVYCGQGTEDYLQELGSGLDKEVGIFWTGPEVCSFKIEGSDLDQVISAVERKPILWDNYPVNDAMMTPELHIGPYINRSADLRDKIGGVFVNPMNQLTASLITLHAIRDYLEDPDTYDSMYSWREGITEVVGEDLTEEFCHFAYYNLLSPIHSIEMNPYARIWKKGFKVLEVEAKEMQRITDALTRGLKDKELGREIWPWLEELEFMSRLAAQAVEVEKGLKELFHLSQTNMTFALCKTFYKLQQNLNRLRRLLQKVPQLQTAVTGDLVYDYGLQTNRSVEGLLKIYIDQHGIVLKLIRRILTRF